MKIIMLGCGSSTGVPEIGCECAVCASKDPKNQRSRVSIHIEVGGAHILIDTSPDLRLQAISNGIKRVDAILYTHDHADHTHGIDDIKSFNRLQDAPIPIYANEETMASLKERFSYAMQPRPEGVWYRAAVIPHIIPESLKDFDVLGVRVTPILQNHARMTSLGFRIGNFAYSTDVNGFSEESFAKLEGLDVWIVDCLQYASSYTHSRLELTLEWIARLKPKRAIFTHMAHQFDYATLAAELPPGVEPGYDGLIIEST